MDNEQQTQRQWIEDVQKRYREIQAKYLACVDRDTASHLAVEMRILEAAIMGIELGAKRGICISCEVSIPPARLAIIQWTLWCTSCAEAQNLATRSIQELLFPLKLA